MVKRLLIGIGIVTLVATIVIGIRAYFEMEKNVEIRERVKGFRSFKLPPRPVIDGTWTRYRCLEDKIAGFDFSEGARPIEAEVLLNTFGAGCADKAEDTHGRRSRYFIPKAKTYVELAIEPNCGRNGCLVNVKITGEAISPKECVPKADFKTLCTGKGLQLGDSVEKVRKLYGAPYDKGKPDDKSNRYSMFYSDLAVSPYKGVPPEGTLPGHAMNIVLENNKVVSIEFITGE